MKSKKKYIVLGILSTIILGVFLFSMIRSNAPSETKKNVENPQKFAAEKDNTDLTIYETAKEAREAIQQEVEHKNNNEKVKSLYKNENEEIIEMIGIYETVEEAKEAIEQVIEHKGSNEKVKVLFKNTNGETTEMFGIFETAEEARKIMQQELKNKENEERVMALFKDEEGEIATMIGMKSS